MNNPICFYHSGDMDGKCSAAIVKRKIPNVELYGIDYQDIPNFPWDKVQHRDVIMVDFSLPRESMERLLQETKRVYWIDHHKTAMADMKDLRIEGLCAVELAACELTYIFFYPTEPVPELIRLIGRWDVWDHSDPRTEPFHYGIESCYTDPNNPKWLDYDINIIIDIGYHIMSYQEKIDKETMERAYPVTINGYSALAVNAPQGSKKFNQHPDKDKYDIYICYVFTDINKCRVSLYTEKDNIYVGEIAKSYGGGGHKQAAGFITTIIYTQLLFDLK